MTLLDDELSRSGGVLRCRDHPHLRSAISRATTRGELVRPVPGVVAVPSLIDNPLARVRIAALWQPGDVLCLDAAAHLTITARSALPQILLAGPATRSHGGFRIQHRRVPPQWVMLHEGLLVTHPSMTVADQLCVGRTSDLYDALRQRLVTLASVRSALEATRHRRGAASARRLLWEARENPWSDGEAVMHATFRAHGLRGWKGNLRIRAAGGTFYGDAVFRARRLIVELDGRGFHSSERDLRGDRARRNLLTAAGWRVIVVTMEMLLAWPDETVDLIRTALTKDKRE